MPGDGTLLPSWNLVRVYGTWALPDGSALIAGTYTVTTPRLTSSTDDAIIPAGKFLTGNLNTIAGSPSLDILVPATDDPDIEQSGYTITITVKLTIPGGGTITETYVINVPLANRPITDGGNGLGVNLRTQAQPSQIATAVAQYGIGVPGGLATLSTDGLAVLDANGDAITGSGGGGTSSGTDLDSLPAGTQIAVAEDPATGWPARPTARTDLLVVWYGGTLADPPTGALAGDQWVRPLS